MNTHRFGMPGLFLSILGVIATACTQLELQPFRDSAQERWGYKRSDGTIAIPARYIGAGQFQEGRAPVEDADGFAIIDEHGSVLERIGGSVSGSGPIAPPSAMCAWSGSTQFPSSGLECYIRQLHGSGPVVGGEIARVPTPGEGFSSAVALKLPLGVVVIEQIAYEGFSKQVLLPGATATQALQWRRMLYPDRPIEQGCSESWSTGTIPGGAFIEQSAGC